MIRKVALGFSTCICMCTFLISTMCCLFTDRLPANETELAVLNEQNYDHWVPQGKEVDAIYGDIVLRNENVVAVIARPGPRRHANMTVGNVGGCIIDCTRRNHSNDQLSAYYPLAGQFRLTDPAQVRVLVDKRPIVFESIESVTGSTIRVEFNGPAVNGKAKTTIAYQLTDSDNGFAIETIVDNSEGARAIGLRDMIRADRTFKFGMVDDQLGWAYDDWFRQAYGVQCVEKKTRYVKDRRDFFAFYDDATRLEVAPGETGTLTRSLIPARDVVELMGLVFDDERYRPVNLKLVDPNGPVEDASVVFADSDRKVFVRTDHTGQIEGSLPAGNYQLTVDAPARPTVTRTLQIEDSLRLTLGLEACGFLSAKVNDQNQHPIPFKISIFGVSGTKDPFFGPDSRAQFVMNAAYSADGELDRLPLAPGKYQCLISRGPEFDAELQDIEVQRNEVTEIAAVLNRSVNSPGWISAEYHSHSSPSGDNTSDQLGRVFNLLAEHIEFAPCTEHNRIDSYRPHLEALDAVEKMATCTGMELTGGPLPVNHQNAFPLVRRPRTQDGGAPATDGNPVVQIERLAMWDSASEKLVQMNHPNLMQVLGDQDANGQADQGFTKMFNYTDVIEIHPLQAVFRTETTLPEPGTRGNTIFQWMQLLNQGYRIPGVVNTDAHYNFHGSGWLRNYVQSSTDDPAEIDTLEMVRNSSAGKIIMTNGPYMTVTVAGTSETGERVEANVGDDVRVGQPKLSVHVTVQCPNWLDVNRVQILINGRAKKDLDFTRRTHSDFFKSGVVKFDQEIDVEISQDSHLIVAAAGVGLKLGRVVGPSLADRMPVAVSNPIYLDFDGNGFQPNGDKLGAPMTLPVNR